VCFEVIGRGSPNFIRLPNNCRNSLIDGTPAAMLICIAHHLGDSWELVCEARKLASLLL
jgi:hypothetical protein